MKFLSFSHIYVVAVTAMVAIIFRNESLRVLDVMLIYGAILANVRFMLSKEGSV